MAHSDIHSPNVVLEYFAREHKDLWCVIMHEERSMHIRVCVCLCVCEMCSSVRQSRWYRRHRNRDENAIMCLFKPEPNVKIY